MNFQAPRLEKLVSQPEVQRLLTGLFQNRSAQTLLWTGPEGSGKKTYALALVRNLFCQEGPGCVGCAVCKQVLAKTHPDLFWVHRDHFFVDPEESDYDKEMKKQGITVKVAQHIARKLNKAAFSAPMKVAVVLDAEDLNKDAQNVLLKTLEEPPANSLIILLAAKTGEFLPTVLSRCRQVRFPAFPDKTIESLLTGTYGWEKDKAQKAARESAGNMSQALKSADKEWNDFRDKVCADFDRGLSGPEAGWLAISNEYEKMEPDFLGDRERTATQRKAEVLNAAFQAYLGLWTGRLRGNLETPAKLASLPPDIVLKCLQKHQDMVPTNLNARMILDHLFLELRDGFEKGGSRNRPFVEAALEI